ncbi:MAG TPA: IclR family transcriptional regulator [Eoetvoesiella sp.]
MDVKTASRVFEVLNLFAEVKKPLIYSDISRRLDIPLSSCHALLKTMVSHGYLYAPGIRAGYYPTQRLLHVAQAICSMDPLISLFNPLLVTLRDITRETAVLAKLAGDQVVYLSVVESNQTIRYSHEPGGFKFLHATASGKALLGALAPATRKKMLNRYKNWEKITEHTTVDHGALEADILEGQARGWQRSYGENVDDVMAVAKGFMLNDEAFCFVIAGPLTRVKRNEQAIAEAIDEVQRQIPPELLMPLKSK